MMVLILAKFEQYQPIPDTTVQIPVRHTVRLADHHFQTCIDCQYLGKLHVEVQVPPEHHSYRDCEIYG